MAEWICVVCGHLLKGLHWCLFHTKSKLWDNMFTQNQFYTPTTKFGTIKNKYWSVMFFCKWENDYLSNPLRVPKALDFNSQQSYKQNKLEKWMRNWFLWGAMILQDTLNSSKVILKILSKVLTKNFLVLQSMYNYYVIVTNRWLHHSLRTLLTVTAWNQYGAIRKKHVKNTTWWLSQSQSHIQ